MALLGTATVRVTPDMTGVTSSSFRSKMALAGKVAGAALGAAFVAESKRAIETTQQLAGASANLSRNLGLQTKEASRWASVARTRDIDTKQLTASFATLSKSFVAVRNEGAGVRGVLKSLGLTQKDVAMGGERLANAARAAARGSKEQRHALMELGITEEDLHRKDGALAYRLQQSLQTTTENVSKQKAAFEDLGITQQDLAQTDGDFNKVIMLVADAFGNAKGSADRFADAQVLLGRGYQNLLPLMADGSDALQKQLELGDKYGATMGKGMVDAQMHLTSTLRESQRAWQGLEVQLGTALTPALEDVNKQFQEIAKTIADPHLTEDEKFSKVAEIIQRDFETALDFVIEEVIPRLASEVGQAAPKVAGALVQGFLGANAWGRLAIGAWLLTKFGAWGKVASALGLRIGGTIATTTATSASSGLVAGEAKAEMGAAATTLGKFMGPLAAAAFVVAFAPEIKDLLNKSVLAPLFPEKTGTTSSEALNDQLAALGLPGQIVQRGQGTAAQARFPGAGIITGKGSLSNVLDKAIQKLIDKYGSLNNAADQLSHKQKQAWNDIFGSVSTGTIDSGKKISDFFQVLSDQGRASRGELDSTIKDTWQGISQLDDKGLANRRSKLVQMVEDQRSISPKMLRSASELLENLDHRIGGGLENVDKHWTAGWNDLADKADKSGKKIVVDADGNLSLTARNAIQRSQQMATRTVANFAAMAAGSERGVGKLAQSTNDALRALGVNQLDFNLAVGKVGNIVGHAQTGAMIVPGNTTGDSVPVHAMVEPHEVLAVLNRNAAEKWMAWNEAFPRFQTGGFTGMQPGIVSLIKNVIGRFGGSMSSGFRPGDDGFHGRGLAADWVGGDWTGASRYVNSIGPSLLEGIHQAPPGLNVSWDSGHQVPPSFWGAGTWAEHTSHIHMAISGMAKAIETQIKRAILTGPDGPLKDMGQAALDKVRKAANEYIARHVPSGSFDTAAVSGGWQGINSAGEFIPFWDKVNPDLKNYARAFSIIVPRESGYDPHAGGPGSGNPTHAGWYQFDSPTWSDFGQGSWPSGPYDPGLATAAAGNVARREGRAGVMSRWAETFGGFMRGGLAGRFASGGRAFPGIHGEHSRSVVRSVSRISARLREEMRDIAKTDERIDLAGRLASLATSPAGTDLAPSERQKEIHLELELLGRLVDARALARKGLRTAGVHVKAKSHAGERLTGAAREFRDTIVALEGLTGEGGRIFDTRLQLADLRAQSAAHPAFNIDQLLRFAEAMRFGAFNGSGPPRFHQGGYIVPPGGASEMPLIGKRDEYVMDQAEQSRVRGALADRGILVGDIYIGGEKIDERVEVRLREHDRAGDARYRAGVV